MRVAFYREIVPAAGRTVAWTIREAQRRCGITLMQFAGWADADLGYAGNRGPQYAESRRQIALRGD